MKKYFLYTDVFNLNSIYIVDEAHGIITKKHLNSKSADTTWTYANNLGYLTVYESLKKFATEISEAEAFIKLL